MQTRFPTASCGSGHSSSTATAAPIGRLSSCIRDFEFRVRHELTLTETAISRGRQSARRWPSTAVTQPDLDIPRRSHGARGAQRARPARRDCLGDHPCTSAGHAFACGSAERHPVATIPDAPTYAARLKAVGWMPRHVPPSRASCVRSFCYRIVRRAEGRRSWRCAWSGLGGAGLAVWCTAAHRERLFFPPPYVRRSTV